MTAKSVIEIDVQDERFQNFMAAFELYKEQLEELPDYWREQAQEITKTTATGEKAVDSASSLAEKFSEAVTELQLVNTHLINISSNTAKASTSADGFQRGAGSAKAYLEGGAKAAGKMAADIKDATLDFLKWSSVLGLFGGLVGAGGMFGINRMAMGAGAQRFTALGLGVTAGELTSTQVNYAPALSDPTSTLGKIRDAQQDLSKGWILKSLGVDTNQDPAQQLPKVLESARDRFNQVGGTQQGAHAYGLDQIFTMDELNRIKNMSNAEIEAMGARAEQDKKQFQISDQVLRQWQQFDIQVDRSEQGIRKAFIEGLAPLAPQLTTLSTAVENFITHMLTSPRIGEWIDSAAQGLDKLSSYLTSDKFQHDADHFLEVLGELATGLGHAAEWVASLFGNDKKDDNDPSNFTPVTYKNADGTEDKWWKNNTTGEFTQDDPAKRQTAPESDNPFVSRSRIANDSTIGDQTVKQGSQQIPHIDNRSWISHVWNKAVDDINDSRKWSDDWKQERQAPISERNHNPLNLRKASTQTGTSGGFATFDNDADAFRASVNQLQRYAAGKTTGTPVTSIQDIISTWAPKADKNDTEGYIERVVKLMNKDGQHVTAASNIDLNNNTQLMSLMAAMSQQENHRSRYKSGNDVRVVLENNTGGNVYASMGQLAGGQ